VNDFVKPSGTRNTTILLILLGLLDISLGYQSVQFSLIMSSSILMIVAALMIVFGVLTFCASLVVWLQKSWATKVIAGVAVATCVTLIIFGYYTITFIVFAPLYWLGIHWIGKGQSIDIPDWAPSWDED
jgi:uncharacterized membrane protein (DUF2068 family)